MTTLVTGAFGCIGSWVVRGLLADGERPVAFDLGDDPWRLRMIAGDDVTSRVTLVHGDVTDREAVARCVREHDVRRIIHLAAWQVPLCRQDPAAGRADQRRRHRQRLRGGARPRRPASSASSTPRRRRCSGRPRLYPPGPLRDDAPHHPTTHYGVYKVANEAHGARSLGGAPHPLHRLPAADRSTARAATSA